MKRIDTHLTLFILLLQLVGGTFAFAQSETDAYRVSQHELNGTARFTALGGAFTALGGDPSSVKVNPAGAAVAHRSTITFTPSVISRENTSSIHDFQARDKHVNGSLGEASAILSFFNPSSGNGFTLGVHYTQTYRMNRTLSSRNIHPQQYSLADYVSLITPDYLSSGDLGMDRDYDPYGQSIPWFSVLGFNGGWISPTKGQRGPFETSFFYPKGDGSTTYIPYGPATTALAYSESAKLSETDFTLGYNYKDRLYLGLSLKLASVSYRLTTEYHESFIDGDYLALDNSLRTAGSGVGGSFGIIVRPTDHLRLGLSVHTPTILLLTDDFEASASSRYSHAIDPATGDPYPKDMWVMRNSTPKGRYPYRTLTPTRINTGIAYTFGRFGLISFDYELTPYGSMRLFDDRIQPLTLDNRNIKRHYAVQHGIRVGAEAMVTRQLALRAGYAFQSSPLKDEARDLAYTEPIGNSNNSTFHKAPFYVAGTLPHYVTQGASHTITFGVGYRFSRSIALDLAGLYHTQREELHAFPTIYDNAAKPLVYAATPTKVRQSNLRFMLTMALYL